MMWNKDLETGVKQIDDEHKRLFELIDNVLQASIQQKGASVVGNTLDFLSEYVVEHFDHEQKLQTDFKYPRAIEHKIMHDSFVMEVDKLKAAFKSEGATLSIVLLTNKTVVDWLTKHINTFDKDFTKYYKENINTTFR